MNIRKLLFRTPVKTLITFVLLIVTCYSFVSRGVEFVATERTISAATEGYNAVGTLVSTAEKYAERYGSVPEQLQGTAADGLPYYSPIEGEALDLLMSSEYVEASELRHVAGGISDAYLAVPEQPVGLSVNNSNRLALNEAIVIAECIDVRINENIDHPVFNDVDWECIALMTVKEVLAGDARQYSSDSLPTSVYFGFGTYQAENPIFYLEFDYEPQNLETYLAGHRYVMSLAPESDNYNTWDYEVSKVLSPSSPYPLLDLTLIEQEKGSVGYEDYAHILESRYGRILAENAYKQDLVYTSDMSMLPRFHDGTLCIVEGRMLTPEDTDGVCVINTEYASRNGIAVGDTVSFTVDPDAMVYAGEVFSREAPSPESYAVASRYSSREPEQVSRSYEVVGIWSVPHQGRLRPAIINERENYDTDPLIVSDTGHYDTDALVYAKNTVFLPASSYPWQGEVEPYRFPSTFSFELKNPGYADELEDALSAPLLEMGYELVINDAGYSEAESAYLTLRLGALLGLVTMSIAMLLSFMVLTYLAISGRKAARTELTEFGVPEEKLDRVLLLEQLAPIVAAVPVSCVIAALTIRGFATSLAASISDVTGAAASATYSPWLIPLFGIGALALLVLSSIGLNAAVRRSTHTQTMKRR